ncbi:MAG: AgmX/PglI C-terminal domain-containing protein [Myxococcota bacterium]
MPQKLGQVGILAVLIGTLAVGAWRWIPLKESDWSQPSPDVVSSFQMSERWGRIQRRSLSNLSHLPVLKDEDEQLEEGEKIVASRVVQRNGASSLIKRTFRTRTLNSGRKDVGSDRTLTVRRERRGARSKPHFANVEAKREPTSNGQLYARSLRVPMSASKTSIPKGKVFSVKAIEGTRDARRGQLQVFRSRGLPQIGAPGAMPASELEDKSESKPPQRQKPLSLQLLQEVRSYRGSIRSCYERMLKSRDVSGKLWVQIDIQTDGHVSRVQITKSPTQEASFLSCVQKHIQTWRFRTQIPEGLVIEVPFDLRTREQSDTQKQIDAQKQNSTQKKENPQK